MNPSANPSASKLRQVALLWALALGISALLVAAGHHWPETPPIRPGLALALVLLPPLAMGWWLWRNWRLHPASPGDQNRKEPEYPPTDLERF